MTDSTSLMSRRIRRILLVCNNYDNFSLEEEGRLEDRVSREYGDLSLSNPPVFIRAESTVEALERAEKGEAFDLVKVLRFSPSYHKNVLQTSTPALTMRDTQQVMYALNLQPEKFKTSVDDAVNLEECLFHVLQIRPISSDALPAEEETTYVRHIRLP